MTVAPSLSVSLPAPTSPSKTFEPDPDVLARVDRTCELVGTGFVLSFPKPLEDYESYEKQTTPANLLIEVFEPLVEYGHTDSYIYWVEARLIELKDL